MFLGIRESAEILHDLPVSRMQIRNLVQISMYLNDLYLIASEFQFHFF
jgi:hypothetical protein